MKKNVKKIGSLLLCLVLVLSSLAPGIFASAAKLNVKIYKDNAEVTEVLHITEYASVQLSLVCLDGELPAGSHIEWDSDMPLLADVDENGKVTAYDYSKAAVIRYWLDNEVRTIPVIGEITARNIENAFKSAGIDLNDSNLNTDLVVAIVKGINADLGTALENILNNMTIEISARVIGENGEELGKATADVSVDQSFAGNLWPTGVHITNKKTVPKTVAVGAQVQLYGAVTPVRLKQKVKWVMGGGVLDIDSAKHATISADGLLTFTSEGKVSVRATAERNIYAAVTDSVSFNVVSPDKLPVEDFNIAGNLEIKEGETTQLYVTDVLPAGAYAGNVRWESSDPAAAPVNQDGVVAGLDAGSGLAVYKNVTVTAYVDTLNAQGEVTGTVSKSVTVKINKNIIGATLSSVEINGYDTVGVGETNKFSADVSPVRLNENKDVVRHWGIYHSETGELIFAEPGAPADNGFASLDTDGNLTARSSGIIKIYVRADYNGASVEAEKQVSAGIPIESFTLAKGNGFTVNVLASGDRVPFLEEGKEGQILVQNILPADYDPELLDNIIWSSSDPTVATVDQNGLVLGLDAGGFTMYHKKTVTITANVGGVSASITFDVRGSSRDRLSHAGITGGDAVVKDFPRAFGYIFSPSRIDVKNIHWGLVTDSGDRPWEPAWGSTSGNTENSLASVDAQSGTVTAKSAGTTTLWLFGREGRSSVESYAESTKELQIVELTPKSIGITAPTKYDYLEGDTELDLSGLEVKLTYDRADLAEYYPEASEYDESQLTVSVTDYEIRGFDPDIIDKEQFIIVTVTRAGKQMRTLFPVMIHSKQVESIDIEAPRYKYFEGETELDLTALRVFANYSNAPREEVFDYTVDASSFNPELLDEEQTVTVSYEHYGRAAQAEFKVIVYSRPVISVDLGGYDEGWTNGDVHIKLSCIHARDSVKYYYSVDGGEWQEIAGDELIVSENTNGVYSFKAVDDLGAESLEAVGVSLKIDKVAPSFTLNPEKTELTNSTYRVDISALTAGASGIRAVYLNDEDITGQSSFIANENGVYTVKVISVSGMQAQQSITVGNIDTEKPEITEITVEHKEQGGFARFINKLTFGLFFNKTVEITVTAEDKGIAGVANIEYRFLNEAGEPIGDWQIYDPAAKPVQNPNFKGFVEARATDKAGNVSDTQRSEGYVIDGDEPSELQITAVNSNGAYESDTWSAGEVKIELSSTAFSGIYKYYYSVNGGEWIELDGSTLVINSQGVGAYRFKAVSNSDNHVETQRAFIVKIDNISPTLRVDLSGAVNCWTSQNVKFSLSLLSEAISGITYYYSTDGGESWQELTSAALSAGEGGINSYVFKAVNGAGTESTVSDSYTVMIDKTTPTLEYTLGETQPTSKPYEIFFTVNAGEAGLRSVSVNGEDVSDKASFTVSRNGVYVFVMVGENSLVGVQTVTVENFVPTAVKIDCVTFSGNEAADGYFGGDVLVNITASCTGSEVAETVYRLLDENKEPITDWLLYSEAEKPLIKANFSGYVEAMATAANGESSEKFTSALVTADSGVPTIPEVVLTTSEGAYNGEWTAEKVTVTLASQAFSGIAEYQYRAAGGEWISLASNTAVLELSGENSYEFRAVSKAGFESGSVSRTVKIDSAVPVLQIGIVGAVGVPTENDVIFTLSAPNVISGAEYYYSTDGGSTWEKISGDKLTVSESCDRVYIFKAVSLAGTESYVSPEYHLMITKAGTELVATSGRGGVVDNNRGYVYGIEIDNGETVYDCFEATNGASINVVANAMGMETATGAVLQLIDADGTTVIAEYTVIIFGDVNGNGYIDTDDRATVSNVANYLSETIDSGSPEEFAADLNASGYLDTDDSAVISNIANYLTELSQAEYAQLVYSMR